MYRYAINDLITWKNSPNHMPLIIKGARVTEPNMPLKAYEYVSAYKLFLFDVGLLGALNDLD